MTRSREKGDSPVVDFAKKEAVRTGRTVSEILEEMLAEAKRTSDAARKMSVQRAQKFLKVRNKRKRRRK